MRIIQAAVLAFAVSCCVHASAQSSDGSIGEVFATDASVKGSVILAGSGMRVGSGSTVSAGRTAASLRLERGGEVRVCPGTSVSVTASSRSQGLMLSLDAGTIETDYSVGSSADTIQTPDFRIMLPGPGDFHFAVAADRLGNACVRALDGNSASIVVTEMMGEGSYQVRPNEQVTFSKGSVANAVPFGRCGCAAAPQTLRADTPNPQATYSISSVPAPPPPIAAPLPEDKVQPRVAETPAPPAPAATATPAPAQIAAASEPPMSSAEPPVPPPAASKSGEVHVQVDVPMVYSADAAPSSTAPPAAAVPQVPMQPEPMYLPANVYFALFRPVMDVPTVQPAPPPATAQKERKGFFGRLKSFFGGMFK